MHIKMYVHIFKKYTSVFDTDFFKNNTLSVKKIYMIGNINVLKLYNFL